MSSDQYAIGREDGNATLKRLYLTGWSGTLGSWTTDGRIWATMDTANGLQLYSTSEKAAGDLLASGSIGSGGSVTLAQANTSGISGTALVSGTVDATGSSCQVQISYADQAALLTVLRDASSLLTSGDWQGRNGYEAAFLAAYEDLTNNLRQRLLTAVPKARDGRPDLLWLGYPSELARVHAMLTAAVMLQWRAGQADVWQTAATDMRRDADRTLRALNITLDDPGRAYAGPASVPLSR